VQVWFPGVHANIGGGYNDQELANNSLAWMFSMLEPLLDIDTKYLLVQDRANIEYYKSKRERVRPWSFGNSYYHVHDCFCSSGTVGKIYNSESSYFALGGAITRTPGDYFRVDPRLVLHNIEYSSTIRTDTFFRTGNVTNKPLRNTNEYIHASVRSRFVLNGPGYADKGAYDPKALRDYRIRYEDVGLATPWFWEDQGPERIILPEAPLRDTELMLLRGSADVEEYVLNPPSPRRSRRP